VKGKNWAEQGEGRKEGQCALPN
jgi:hypothetical protein